MSRNHTTLLVTVMTAAEAAAVTIYITVIHSKTGAGGVYSELAVAAGGILLLGLIAEAITVYRTLSWTIISLAVTEVVIWTQWANLVTLGLWSRRGIGPAFIVLATLLVLQHAVETQLLTDEPPLVLRHGLTAIVEAMTATVGWVLITNGHAYLAAVVITMLLFVEHATRVTTIRHDRR